MKNSAYFFIFSIFVLSAINCRTAAIQSTTPPNTPSRLTAAAFGDSLMVLNWRDNSPNEKGFIIERASENDSVFTIIATVEANVTTYDDKSVKEGTTYQFLVRSFIIVDDIRVTSASSNIGTKTTRPSPPTKCVAKILCDGRIVVTWSDNSDKEDGYTIERAIFPEDAFSLIGTTGEDGNYYVDEGPFVPGTRYVYRICAFREALRSCCLTSILIPMEIMNNCFDWLSDLTIATACEEVEILTLLFGQASSATDGIDTVLGETVLPPLSVGDFDARFELPTEDGSRNDFRATIETSVDWLVELQAGSCNPSHPMEITWESSSFPAGTFTLKDAVTGGERININMKSQSSYTLLASDSDITSLIIEYRPE